MAAAQPFISGAISKTVNMPKDATPEDVADAYHGRLAAGAEGAGDLSRRVEGGPAAVDEEQAATRRPRSSSPRPRRERLPDTRQSITHKFNISGHEGYITVGLYPDGRPGELFITMAKEGSTIGGLMDCFGTAVSMSLQYGVPLEVYVNKFSHTRFEPWASRRTPTSASPRASWITSSAGWGSRSCRATRRRTTRPAVARRRRRPNGGDAEQQLRPVATKAGGPAAGPGAAKTNAARPRPTARATAAATACGQWRTGRRDERIGAATGRPPPRRREWPRRRQAELSSARPPAANSSPASRPTPPVATVAAPSPSAPATATSATTAATAWAARERGISEAAVRSRSPLPPGEG